MKKYILIMDSGTTSVRSVIFDKKGKIVNISQKEINAVYPNVGWVEQNPMEILASQIGTMQEVLVKSNIKHEELISIGITNQRETVVAWDKTTGIPVYNAIVWQDRRTNNYCRKLNENKKLADSIRHKTGLVIDSYFSGTKMKWILDNVSEAKKLAHDDKLLFGTIDTWLIWNLTKKAVHATDYTNASRTLIFDIQKLKWDDELLKLFGISEKSLPEVKFSDDLFGNVDTSLTNGAIIPITGVVGDQQSSLFGHYGVHDGDFKATFGTGTFMLQNIGEKFKLSNKGLITTIGIGAHGKISYAFEGSVFTSGTVLKWIRDGIRIIHEYEQVDYYATKKMDASNVYFVPSFNGLGAPYWKSYAKGTLVGIDANTKRGHIVKATIDGIGFQLKDLVDAFMSDYKGKRKPLLNVDGGLANSNYFLQFLSNISKLNVQKQESVEITAQGSFFLSALGSKTLANFKEIEKLVKVVDTKEPKMPEDVRKKLIEGWEKAIKVAVLYAELNSDTHK